MAEYYEWTIPVVQNHEQLTVNKLMVSTTEVRRIIFINESNYI